MNITLHEFGGEIRCTEAGQPSVFDMIRVIGGKKSPREVWKRLCEQYPEVVRSIDFFKFPGRGQQLTPVLRDQDGVDLLLSLVGRSSGVISGAMLVTSNKYFPRAETQIAWVLSEAFSDQQPCPQFFCQGYRIDLYLAKSRIAIEIDENGHSQYDKAKEQQREAAIKSSLGCSFIRFDPYLKDFNLGTVIARIRALVD